jgi:hypothetical protein
MDLVLITLRLPNIVAGTLRVGFGEFVPAYLGPALEEAGPQAGNVMCALQRRGLTTVLPLLALGSIFSGLWLYVRVSGGLSRAYLVSGPAPALQSMAAAASGEERERLMTTARVARARGGATGRIGAVLLLPAAAGMAVGRYL